MHGDHTFEQGERRARRARSPLRTAWARQLAACGRPPMGGRRRKFACGGGAVAGDRESDEVRVFPHLRRLHRVAPDVRTILHAGGVRWAAPPSIAGRTVHEATGYIPRLGCALAESGIDRLIVVPGIMSGGIGSRRSSRATRVASSASRTGSGSPHVACGSPSPDAPGLAGTASAWRSPRGACSLRSTATGLSGAR